MELYLPKNYENFTQGNSWRWYNNIPIELKTSFLSLEYSSYFKEYYIEAGLLRRWRRPFFRYHYARTFALAVSFLFPNHNNKPVILDLGCGTGTQSIAFALLGAKVIALDMDETALQILEKRKAFYEQQLNYSIDIEIHKADVFKFNYEKVGPIDGVFSLFAFNMMKPTDRLLGLIFPHISDRGKFSILDGNKSCWASIFPSRKRIVLSPEELSHLFTANGYVIQSHYGGVVFPPALWTLFPYYLLGKMDSWIGSLSWLFPISHLLLAKHG
jgi:SAM-dependent methyltransferase